MRTRLVAALSIALLAACSRKGEDRERARLFSRDPGAAAPAEAPFDPDHPETALAMGADDAARRIGSFEWTGAVDWTVTRGGGDAAGRIHVAEKHVLRQSADGAFESDTELDPGLGPGSESGRSIVYAGGTTYAKTRYMAAFRARDRDRGHGARRYRDQSFRMAAEVAALYGRALAVQPAGDGEALGRPARRYRFALAPGESPPAPPAGRTFAANGPDEDTKRHLAFLEGAVPLEASGELLVDAATGVPLLVRLKGALGVKTDPTARAAFELVAQVKALGAAVAAVVPPPGALPDARTPPGVAGALQAAGLAKNPDQKAGTEPGDDE